MGARAQVKIKDTGVYLYTHWGSGSIAENVQDALSRRERWNDPEYLARIIFDQMTVGQAGGSTGFGIGASQHGDIEVLITVDTENQLVTVTEIYEKQENTHTFADFVDLVTV